MPFIHTICCQRFQIRFFLQKKINITQQMSFQWHTKQIIYNRSELIKKEKLTTWIKQMCTFLLFHFYFSKSEYSSNSLSCICLFCFIQFCCSLFEQYSIWFSSSWCRNRINEINATFVVNNFDCHTIYLTYYSIIFFLEFLFLFST